MQNLSPDVIAPADIQTPEVVVALPVKLLFAGGLGTIAISLALAMISMVKPSPVLSDTGLVLFFAGALSFAASLTFARAQLRG